MRMGIVNKKKRVKQKKPLFDKRDKPDSSIVGEISPNLITSIYTDKITDIMTSQTEQYAESILNYNNAMNIYEMNNGTEADLPDKPSESLLFSTNESREEFLTTVLEETSNNFSSKGKSNPKWKVYANAAKFERQLDEKYGRFRPFITQHPEIEIFIRNTQRKFARGEYSPFRQGDPPIDKKSAIILLFIMHRNGASMQSVALTALFFLIGLQPWALVLLVIIGRQMMESRKKKKISSWKAKKVKTVKPYYASKIEAEKYIGDAETKKAKHCVLMEPVGTPLKSADLTRNCEDMYDTIIVGSGPSTLYTAALLSRTGRTVLVLSPDKDASGAHFLGNDLDGENECREKYANVPFDLQSNHVAHTSRQQRLLAPALCTDSDAQGGIRFAQIGSQADGFTSDILSIPGMGVDNSKECVPYLLRAGGILSIANDAAMFLADGWPSQDESDGKIGNSVSAGYASTCSAVNSTSSQFYLSKLLSDKMRGNDKSNSYKESGIRYASGFLDKIIPLNAHVRSLMAGMGMRGENLRPSEASMAAHTTNVAAFTSPEGFTYPVGGPRALCHALATVIEQNGGKVVTGARIKEFYFEDTEIDDDDDENNTETTAVEDSNDEKDSTESNSLRCCGVTLADGEDSVVNIGTDDDHCVISMLGFMQTFIFNMPDEIRTKNGLPTGLPALNERRPLVHFLIGLQGNSQDLNLTGADWYRLPSASIARDEMDAETGQVKLGTVGGEFYDDENVSDEPVCEVNEEEKDGKQNTRDKFSRGASTKGSKVRFRSGSSWMKISFPSAKDPSWKERHGDVSTCVVTVEADDDFVRQFDSKPKIFSNIKFGPGETALLLEKVHKDLIETYPQLEDKVEFCKMIGPVRCGLSHTPERYAASGISPTIPNYPGLFVGGSDLTVGDSFSAAMVGGWMTANAVLGYSFLDLIHLEKNITIDLSYFIPSSRSQDEAVPFDVIKEEIDSKAKEEVSTAEPSKEE